MTENRKSASGATRLSAIMTIVHVPENGSATTAGMEFQLTHIPFKKIKKSIKTYKNKNKNKNKIKLDTS
jgi:hypothetical protein